MVERDAPTGGGWSTLPRRAALLFALISVAWVVVTDFAVVWLGWHDRVPPVVHLSKGFVYVAASAGVVYWLLRREVRREEALQGRLLESERRLRTQLELCPVAIVVVRDGLVTWSNGAAQRLLSEPGVGWRLAERVAEPARARVEEVLAGDAGSATVADLPARARDGRELRVDVLTQRLDTPEERGVIVSIVDTTLRSAVEAEVRRPRKTEALGHMAAGVVHDLSNLMTALAGYAALARLDLPPGHPARQPVDHIDDLSRQASGLSRSLLAFARGPGGPGATVEARDLVDGLVRAARRAAAPGSTLVVRGVAEVAGRVRCDAGQLQAAVINITLHARDVSGPEGRVTLEASTAGGSALRLAITDSGPTLDAGARARVLEPFSGVTPSDSVGALGLAVARQIVEHHGGTLEVSAPTAGGAGGEERGSGNVYTIVLPLAGQAMMEAKPARSPSAGPAGPAGA